MAQRIKRQSNESRVRSHYEEGNVYFEAHVEGAKEWRMSAGRYESTRPASEAPSGFFYFIIMAA